MPNTAWYRPIWQILDPCISIPTWNQHDTSIGPGTEMANLGQDLVGSNSKNLTRQ